MQTFKKFVIKYVCIRAWLSGIWINDLFPLSNSMLKAILVSAADVITRQYKRYCELEKQMTENRRTSLDTAKTHSMDGEVIGMFSAIKSKVPMASLLFMSCSIKSKKNQTLKYLKALPELEAQAVVTKAVSFAAKFCHCTKKLVRELWKGLYAHFTWKLNKRDRRTRAGLENKFHISWHLLMQTLNLLFLL